MRAKCVTSETITSLKVATRLECGSLPLSALDLRKMNNQSCMTSDCLPKCWIQIVVVVIRRQIQKLSLIELFVPSDERFQSGRHHSAPTFANQQVVTLE